MPTVLIVDDEADVRLVARAVLMSAGYEVEEVASGEAALEFIAQRRPDAVLLDIRMPGMDGWEVLARLRQDGAGSLPVVVFTAHVTAREAAPEELRGFEHILTKPFQPDDLVQAIERVLLKPD